MSLTFIVGNWFVNSMINSNMDGIVYHGFPYLYLIKKNVFSYICLCLYLFSWCFLVNNFFFFIHRCIYHILSDLKFGCKPEF